jgi:hypothetical protein
MYSSNADCCSAFSTSPVVERKTTASYGARLSAVKSVAASVAVTVKSWSVPS